VCISGSGKRKGKEIALKKRKGNRSSDLCFVRKREGKKKKRRDRSGASAAPAGEKKERSSKKKRKGIRFPKNNYKREKKGGKKGKNLVNTPLPLSKRGKGGGGEKELSKGR